MTTVLIINGIEFLSSTSLELFESKGFFLSSGVFIASSICFLNGDDETFSGFVSKLNSRKQL